GWCYEGGGARRRGFTAANQAQKRTGLGPRSHRQALNVCWSTATLLGCLWSHLYAGDSDRAVLQFAFQRHVMSFMSFEGVLVGDLQDRLGVAVNKNQLFAGFGAFLGAIGFHLGGALGIGDPAGPASVRRQRHGRGKCKKQKYCEDPLHLCASSSLD